VYERGAGASKCPDEAQFRERSSDAFNLKDPFVAGSASATSHLRIEIAHADGQYQATIRVVDDSGKTLRSSTEKHDNCDALVWALSHRIAMIVLRKPAPAPAAPPAQASAAPSTPVTPAAPAPLSQPAPAPKPAPPLPVAVTPPCDERCKEARARFSSTSAGAVPDLHVSLFGGALVTAGWMPSAGPGAWLGFAARHKWLSIGFEVRSAAPARAVAVDGSRGASAGAVSGLVVPCVRYRIVSGCAFFEAGTYLFFEPSRGFASTDTLVALGPRVAIDMPLVADISARAFVDLALHPYLPRFEARASAEPGAPAATWVSPIASGLFGLGLAWSG
jgi:hypothetical protein